MLGTTVLNTSAHLVQFAFHRYIDHAPFAEREIALAQRLMPHLRRSIQLLLRARQHQEQAAFNQAALAVSPFGILALSSEGEVLQANSRAERLLQSGLWLRTEGRRISAHDADKTAEIQAALKQVVAQGGAANLNIGGKDAAGHCCLTLIRLPQSRDLGIASQRAAVLCLVTENTGRRVATTRQLMDFFNLTPAEARLVRAIAQGEKLDEYATHQGLKRTTVKSQLKSALTRMGLSGQKDLIRVVAGLPAMRA